MKTDRPLAAIKIEFDMNVQCYKTLVGNLYPAIMYSMLVSLKEEYVDNGGDSRDVILPQAPNSNGYVTT